MTINRRDFLITAGATAVTTFGLPALAESRTAEMYGLIGKMSAVEGQRDTLLSILLESVGEMPGCMSYIVARDPADAAAIWITEVWDSKASHDASLSLPAVQQAITKARPLIDAFGDGVVTTPVGGYGLTKPKSP